MVLESSYLKNGLPQWFKNGLSYLYYSPSVIWSLFLHCYSGARCLSFPGHPLPTKKRPPGGVYTSSISTDSSKMEEEQWMGIQLAIGDSQKFLDLLNGLKWENGLSPDAVNLIESRLATSHTNLAAAEPSGSVPSTADSTGPQQPSRITVSMARHAAESAATMCGFAVAIVEYHYSFRPYKLAVEKLQR